MIREVKHKGELIAMIIRHHHSKPGLQFITPKELTLQMGYMKYPAKHRIIPHIHKPVVREVKYTLEAIVVKSGKVRLDLYTQTKEYIGSEDLEAHDVILLASGGHGFYFLEEGELIEIKQGPYVSQEADKEKFSSEPTTRDIHYQEG